MAGKRSALSVLILMLVFLSSAATGEYDRGVVSGRVFVTGGSVRFAGEPPAPTAIDMSADRFCSQQHDGPVMSRPVSVGPGGGLAGVLVRVTNAPASGASPSEEGLLDQIACLYTPGSVAVRVGQTLVIRNSDATLHNVRVEPTINRGFNLGQPIRGMESRRSFDAAEIGMPVRCDIHGWMTASIHVLDHEFFYITGEDGSFTLPTLPAGDYEVEAWHPTLGTSSQSVSVSAGATPELSFEFSLPD